MMPVGTRSEPLDLKDIRKEQRRCAALLGYNKTWRLTSTSRVSNKACKQARYYDTKRTVVPLNSPTTPYLREQSSGRLQHFTFARDSDIFGIGDACRQESVNSKQRVKCTFYDTSRKVLEKVRLEKRKARTDVNSNGQANDETLNGKEKKLRRHVSIVSIADVQTLGGGPGESRRELRSMSRRDTVPGIRDLALRLEPVSRSGGNCDDGDVELHDSGFYEQRYVSLKEECEMTDVVGVLSESSRRMARSPFNLSPTSKDATPENYLEQHILPKLDSLPKIGGVSSLIRKRSQSTLQRESFDKALVQARRRLIKNGYFPGVYTTCEFTFSYYNKLTNGHPLTTNPRRQRQR